MINKYSDPGEKITRTQWSTEESSQDCSSANCHRQLTLPDNYQQCWHLSGQDNCQWSGQ